MKSMSISQKKMGSLKLPKNSDINSVLIIGAGPIVIGQACEFDYSVPKRVRR